MAEDVGEIIKATENLELSLDELDDNEFDIPAVDNPPTLESILNADEDDQLLQEDDLALHEFLQGDQGETGSVCSQEGILGDKPKRRRKKSIRYEQHGIILRHVVLKGISAQMMSAADRVDAGMPTALAVASLIAVGTSHGLVLVFDPKQVLRWCLGSTAVGAQYGAVSALTFNRDCTRLLCGFAKGQITMWDLTNGKLLRTITDVHPPGTAILHVKFSDDLTVAVCSDSGGSVFELEFKRLIGVRTCESRCLFSGSRGEVCTIEPLHLNHKIQDHPMKDVIILAMASLSKVLIVTVRPELKVMFMHPLKGDPATLPLLAWQFVIIQVSERDRVIDPVLAFARDQTIHYFQVICRNSDDIRVASLQKTEVPYKLLAITWLNSRTMVAVDTSERAHVIDVRTEEELEVVDLADIQLVYSTSFYKSLATGGNVSKALAFSGERACYQSVMTYNGQLVFLGTKGIHVMTCRTWKERLDLLVRQEKYHEALSLGQSFYEGKAKAVVGLGGGVAKRKQMVSQTILQLLDDFVDLSMTRLSPTHGKMEALEDYYQTVVPVCVDYCLMLDRTDILFDKIYERFSSDPIAKGTFLECLEPYILNDKLCSITPYVMKDFVDHYQTRGMVQNVEACIVHMDIASLDIHQVIVLCWTHGLYDAILYIYNNGMRDYITPLEELLTKLHIAVSTGKQLADDQVKLGNKLLVYISCCLAGRAYPMGDIPDDLVAKVKEEVFKCVTCLHTKDPNEEEPAYPHLKTLLKFDTREFFNVLALAFEEPEFNNQDGIEKRQRVVDILLQIMVESIGFTPTQIGILFTFLARQMARHESSIMVNRVLFEQVLESLCASGDDSRQEEREQALLELLTAGGLQHFDQQKLISLAESAEFYHVCELMYEKRREFYKILNCYLRDTFRQHQAFSFIQHIMTGDRYTVQEKQRVQQEALAHLQELVAINSKKTAQLVLVGLASSLTDIVNMLQEKEQLLFEFLKGVFEYREHAGSALYVERQVNIEPHVHELYIDLMCRYQPASVYGYIKGADGYRIEQTLEICRKYKNSEATAFLLEKAGDVEGAFKIILESFQSKMKDLIDILVNNQGPSKPEQDLQVAWTAVQAVLVVLIQLCQRNSGKMDEAERESLWFPLLDCIMAPQRKLKEFMDAKNAEAFKDLTRHVLNSMMGYIALPAILQKIMQDPAYNSGKFGEIKELILGMLDTYNYEKTLLNTCNSLVNHDLHSHLASLTSAANRGIVPRGNFCNLCNKRFILGASDTESVVCFRCGHGYHLPCLKSTGSCHVIDGEENWVCYLCNNAKRGRIGSAGRSQRIPSTSSSSSAKSISQAGTRGGKAKKKLETSLDQEQVQAIDNLRRVQKTTSRLAILTELSKQERSGGSRIRPQAGSIMTREEFQLRLAAPPAVAD